MRAVGDREGADDKRRRTTNQRDGAVHGYAVHFELDRATRRIASDVGGEGQGIAVRGGTGAGSPRDGDARGRPGGDIEDAGASKGAVVVGGGGDGPGASGFSGRAEIEGADGLSAGEAEAHRSGAG